MKLQLILEQLYGVKKYHSMTWVELIKHLESQYGITMKRGVWGQVFIHPSWNYVVKVFDTDNAYLQFVKFAIDNPDKHYPKFISRPIEMHMFHRRSSDIINKKFYIVKIEKLQELDQKHLMFFKLDVIMDLCKAVYNNKENYNLPVVHFKKTLSLSKVVDDITFENQNVKQFMQQYSYMQLETLIPSIIKIIQNFKGKGLKWDLHGKNAMQRSDGTIVITDPYSNNKFEKPFFDYHSNISISGPDLNKITRSLA